jgi:DNA processing protein
VTIAPTLLALRRAAAEIAAEGTDHGRLAQVLSWCVRPRRSPDALRRLCAAEGGPDALPTILARVGSQLDADDARAAFELVRSWRSLGVRCAVVGDGAYPARLAEGWPTSDGPLLLAWRGAPPPDAPAVALVGSRRASGYGTAVTTWLAEAVARAGVRVVSGGAVGIDAAAHRAALAEPGGTTVVLGCGHAIAYPRSHATPGGLFSAVLEQGGTLLSELPPHTPPRAGQVRARNRIVAGLSDAVVVVEGGARSGSLLTAGAAAERGRTVLAVPGDVRAPGSLAPHRLLLEGVGPCTRPEDLFAVLPGRSGATEVALSSGPGPRPLPGASLPPAIRSVLAGAWPRALHVDEVALRSGVPASQVLAALTRARIAGEVAEDLDGVRLRRADNAD